jgi:uncharacterized membrane protein
MQYGRNKRIMVMVQSAMLAALVVVLQLVGSFIKIGPLPMSLVLVPIVIGACLLGVKAGAFLGFVFGLVTVIMGVTGIDGFSMLLFQAKPIPFILLCLLKATMAGVVPALIYGALTKAFKGKNITVQTVIASVSAPIVNTGIFVVGMLVFYYDTMGTLPTLFPDVFGGFGSTLALLFIGLAGLNFVVEFIVNLFLTPVIVRVVDIVKKKIKL